MTTMAATRSFYLSEEAERIIAERSAGGDGRRGDRSGAVEAIITRYASIIEKTKPNFPPGEMRALTNAIERMPSLDVVTIAVLDRVLAISDCPESIVRKVQKLDFAERVALVDEIERRLLKSASGEKR